MSCVSAMAQSKADTTLTQSLTIERAYSPVFKEASKIDRQPAIEEVKVVPTTITYAERKSENVRPNEICNMSVGQVIVEPESDRGGYLDFSAGNYWNTDLKAGYRIGEFTLDATGFFTSGKLQTPFKCIDPEISLPGIDIPSEIDEYFTTRKWQSKLGRGSLVAGYEHTLSNDALLNAHASFSGAFANSFPFGYSPYVTFDDENNEHCVGLLSQKGKETSQRWGQILLDAEYAAERFDVKFEYEHVGIREPEFSENALALEANLLAYQSDSWLLTAGLNTGLTFGEEKTFFSIKPEAEVSFMPDAYSWRRLYAKLGIGTRRANPYHMMNLVPILYIGEYNNTFDLFDLTMGWEDSEHGAFKYGLSANFRYAKDELFGKLYNVAGVGNSYVLPSQDDDINIRLNAYFNYEANRYFGAKANLTFNHGNGEDYGFVEPDFLTDLHLLGHAGKVDMDLSFQGRFGRSMEWFQMGISEVPGEPGMTDFYFVEGELGLGAIADLGFRLDYKYSKTLNFYGFANNILGHEYQLWPGVPAQGFNIHFGANWKF